MPPVSTQADARHAWSSPYGFQATNGFLGVRLSATTASSRAQLVGSGSSLVLTNPGSVECYVALGGSSVTATTSHFPVLPGTQTTLSLPEDASDTWVAVITASRSSTLLAHLGYGV